MSVMLDLSNVCVGTTTDEQALACLAGIEMERGVDGKRGQVDYTSDKTKNQ